MKFTILDESSHVHILSILGLSIAWACMKSSIRGYSIRNENRTYIEILVRHWSHLSPESSHLKLCLICHLSDQLLPKAKFPVKLRSFVTIQIWSLLQNAVNIGANLHVWIGCSDTVSLACPACQQCAQTSSFARHKWAYHPRNQKNWFSHPSSPLFYIKL